MKVLLISPVKTLLGVVDSAASFHVTSRRDVFSSYMEGDFGIVRMGNDGTCKISGIGDVCVETNLGCKLVLKQVRHVPDIRLHLISVGALDDDGYQSSFVGGKWKLMKGSLVVARGNKSSSLYTTKVKLCGEVNAVECSSTDLWHMRLGHMSEKGIGVLSKKNGLPVDGTSLTSCTHCLAGKQHRVNFKRNPISKKSNILDLVHTDLCSMGDRTHGGALYFVTFVDDCSRKLWAYPLKTKDQVFEVFKQFVAEVERETGLKLKCVRSDNGGEYRGPFETFCKASGIKLERSVPKTPQQNGLAERMNRTICEKIRCMLSHSKLSKAFWGEALSTVVHLINRSPSHALDGDVPERVWKGKDVAYDYLRVFGCRAFVHIPRDERSKLDSKTKECIFLGYGVGEFGYRLWDPIEKKIVRSRDVVFFEQDTIEDIKGGDKVKPSLEKPVDLTLISNNEETNQDDAIDVDPQEEEEPHDENPLLDDVPQEQVLRRSTRERRYTSRYPSNEYVLLVDTGEPECFEDAVLSGNKDK